MLTKNELLLRHKVDKPKTQVYYFDYLLGSTIPDLTGTFSGNDRKLNQLCWSVLLSKVPAVLRGDTVLCCVIHHRCTNCRTICPLQNRPLPLRFRAEGCLL